MSRRRSRSPLSKSYWQKEDFSGGRDKRSKQISSKKAHSSREVQRRRSSSWDSGRHHGTSKGRRAQSSSGSRSSSHSPKWKNRRGSQSPRVKRRHERVSISPSESPAQPGSPDIEDAKRSKMTLEEEGRMKEIMKALETPEEKRARRLKKKQEKERRRREKRGWDKKDLDYTNADNPFGDQHLLDKFVWVKKQKMQTSGKQLSKEELERKERQKHDELRRELQKVKQRRLEREKEREAREEEMVLLQRLKEAEQFKQWESQEDQFHLEQAKLRSKIRIESGRANPIDLLAKYVNMTEDDVDIEIQEPYHLLRGLNLADLEDLVEDIEVYRTIEKDTNLDFWKDMTVVCVDEIQKLKKLERNERGETGAERRGGINESVTSEVSAVFRGKTHRQLVALEENINSKISTAGSGTDVGYWEALLQQLKAHMARARLKDKHQAMLRKKLFQLKQEQADEFGVSGIPLFPSVTSVTTDQLVAVKKEDSQDDVESREVTATGDEAGPSSGVKEPESNEPETLIDEEDLLEQAYSDYDSGKYSPKLFRNVDVEEELVMLPEGDRAKRKANRERVLSGETLVSDYSEVEMERKLGEDGMATEEYNFNSEVPIDHQDLLWKEKYRPRKPRFLNRVHTGFEWNKYNQTHYDTDNPPPKIVQGYKFNIFFPDLIDKRKTPTYTLKPCHDNKDFAALRFHGGPPYEDIAFKIVNREWEYSWKHGFKSQFNNNIMQLWFRFKRNRYRR